MLKRNILLFIFILLSISVNAEITDNLQFYLKLDNSTRTGNVYADSTANSRSFVQGVGLTDQPGKLIDAYDCNTACIMNRNDTGLIGTINYSVNMWLKTQDIGADFQQIFMTDVNSHSILLTSTGSGAGNCALKSLCVFDWTYTNSLDFAWSDSWDNVWIMLTIRCVGGSACDIWVNGARKDAGAVSYNNSAWHNWFLGRNDYGGTYYVDGLLDEVGFWSRNITDAEISNLYNSGSGLAYPFSVGINSTDFTAYDFFDGNSITNFTVVISNSTDTFSNSTNTGTVGFYNRTFNSLYNITLQNPQYLNTTYSLNLNNNLTVRLGTQTSTVTVSIVNGVTNSTYTYFNVTYGNSQYNITNGSYTLSTTNTTQTLSFFGSNLWTNYTQTNYPNLSNNVLTLTAYSNQINTTVRSYGSIVNNYSIYFQRLSTDYNQNGTVITTNGNTQLWVLNGTYSFSVDAPGYSLTYQNVTLNGTFLQINFSVLQSTSINITFRDSITHNVLNAHNTTLELISTLQSANYTTSNGTLLAPVLLPAVYTLRYSSTGYPTHFYSFTLVNRTFNNLDLYLLANSAASNVTITIINEYGDPVEEAQVHTSRYDLATNTDILQQICSTNFEGKCSANMQLNGEFYSFAVYYNGNLKKTVTRTIITSTSYQISIILGSSTGQHYFDYKDIDYALYYTNSSKTFTMFYSDSESLASAGCLYVYSAPLFGSNPVYTLSNTSCATGASSTLTATIIPVNNTRYRADAFVTKSGSNFYLGSVYINYRSDVNDFGREALILCVLLTLVVLFAFYGINPNVAIGLMPMPLFVFTAIGLINLNLGIVSGLYAVIIIVIIGVMER